MHQPGPRPATGHCLCAADCQADAHVDFQHLSTVSAPSPRSAQSEDLKPLEVSSAWSCRTSFALPSSRQEEAMERLAQVSGDVLTSECPLIFCHGGCEEVHQWCSTRGEWSL